MHPGRCGFLSVGVMDLLLVQPQRIRGLVYSINSLYLEKQYFGFDYRESVTEREIWAG